MYNPALPNHYHDVVFTAYVRRRQREEADILEQQRRPNALACALSALPTSAFAVGGGEGGGSTLHLSAEELHQHRIKASAALGIQSAVDMEKEALEVEHKKKKLEGEDARSRISSRLEKLKALAARSKTLVGGSGVPATGASADQTAAPSADADTAMASTSASSSSPLTFQRSSLAAGGYVMTASTCGAPASSDAASTATATAKRPVRGKPSSTLLLRYLQRSPAAAWSTEQIAHAAAAGVTTVEEALPTPVLRDVQQLCSRYGFVRGVKARVHTAESVATMLHLASTDRAVVLADQLRVWVRYDSVTEAFKAAESLAKEPATVEGPVFSVCFYPTTLFDANTLDLRVEDEKATL